MAGRQVLRSRASAPPGTTRILVPARDIIARGPALIELVPGVLAEECLALYG